MKLARWGIVLALALTLTCCGRSESYRYKLTLAVDTLEGVESGSSVVEVRLFEVNLPERGVMHKLEGEALYLDLGPGKRPLVALLTKYVGPDWGRVPEHNWSPDGGPGLSYLLRLYGEKPLRDSALDDVARLAGLRGPRVIRPSDLPDLVTFANVGNPKSVIAVDPNDLQATPGPGVKWRDLTIESSDEPVTRGIEMKLPWLRGFEGSLAHPGARNGLRTSNELADTLGRWNFVQGGQ